MVSKLFLEKGQNKYRVYDILVLMDAETIQLNNKYKGLKYREGFVRNCQLQGFEPGSKLSVSPLVVGQDQMQKICKFGKYMDMNIDTVGYEGR